MTECVYKKKSQKRISSPRSIRNVRFRGDVTEMSMGGTVSMQKLRQDSIGDSILEEDCSIDGSLLSFKEEVSTPLPLLNGSTCHLETPDIYRAVQLETPVSMPRRKRSSCDMHNVDCSVTVGVRVRPFTSKEILKSDLERVIEMHDNKCTVMNNNATYHYKYDYSFWSFDKNDDHYCNQEQVYVSLAQPLLHRSFQGYNVCLFAYGQTGSGKTYSMMGEDDDPGIIPRFCQELFARVDSILKEEDKLVSVDVEVSFFEIYNEKIFDLLAVSKDNQKIKLKSREDLLMGPYVEGLSVHRASSYQELQLFLSKGSKLRCTAATEMNERSSRSHSVFTIQLTKTYQEFIQNKPHGHNITSKINLVDLAGSERQSWLSSSGDRQREGCSINKSLLALGKVIGALSKGRGEKPSYRESVLTWLLKESLGGNSHTAMLATISPSMHHISETQSTLRYAKQTRQVVNNARVNEDSRGKLIRELRYEIALLTKQQELATNNAVTAEDRQLEIEHLRTEIENQEREYLVRHKMEEEQRKLDFEAHRRETLRKELTLEEMRTEMEKMTKELHEKIIELGRSKMVIEERDEKIRHLETDLLQQKELQNFEVKPLNLEEFEEDCRQDLSTGNTDSLSIASSSPNVPFSLVGKVIPQDNLVEAAQLSKYFHMNLYFGQVKGSNGRKTIHNFVKITDKHEDKEALWSIQEFSKKITHLKKLYVDANNGRIVDEQDIHTLLKTPEEIWVQADDGNPILERKVQRVLSDSVVLSYSFDSPLTPCSACDLDLSSLGKPGVAQVLIELVDQSLQADRESNVIGRLNSLCYEINEIIISFRQGYRPGHAADVELDECLQIAHFTALVVHLATVSLSASEKSVCLRDSCLRLGEEVKRFLLMVKLNLTCKKELENILLQMKQIQEQCEKWCN